MQNNNASVELYYWPIRGLVASVQNLLEYLHIPYTRTNYKTQEEWQKIKASLPVDFPNLPYLKDADTIITESTAIIVYLTIKANRKEMNGKEEDRVRFVQLNGIIQDIILGVNLPAYTSKDLEELKNSIKQFADVRSKARLEGLDALLGKQDWLLGYLTYLDFILVEHLERVSLYDEELGTEVLKSYPKLTAYLKRFQEIPEIKAFRESDRFLKRPVLMDVAIWK